MFEFIFEEMHLFVVNFDKTKEFEKYFPHNNCNKVISDYNYLRRKNATFRRLMIKKKTYVRKKNDIFSQILF